MPILTGVYDSSVFEIDPAKVHQCQANSMLDALLKDMREFFSNPGANEEYAGQFSNTTLKVSLYHAHL